MYAQAAHTINHFLHIKFIQSIDVYDDQAFNSAALGV